VIEAATGKEVSSLNFTFGVTSVVFSPDGRWLAAGSNDKTARVIEAATGKGVSSLEFGGSVNSVAFSPNGRWLAAGSGDKTVRVIEAATGKVVFSLDFGFGVTSVAFSPDGRWLAVGSWDNTARVIEAATGKQVSSLEFGLGVTSVSFSPDGRWLAAGSFDNTARVIEAATGKVVSSPEFGDIVTSVVFSPDGRWLAVGSDDNTACVIEAATGKQVSSVEFASWVTSVAFSPDGRWLAAGISDKTARVIDMNWLNTNYTEGILWGKLLSATSGGIFEDSGKLSWNPQRQPFAMIGKDFFPNPILPSLQPLASWLTDLPDERMASPWSETPLRKQIGEMLMGTDSRKMIFLNTNQAPWHPLVPISLAKVEEDPVRITFLAGLTLNRLRAADPKLWGEETLALYFAKSAEWMDGIDGMELEQVALDTAEEALKRNPDDAGVLRVLENIKARMAD
jgi:WD40 repeat protein